MASKEAAGKKKGAAPAAANAFAGQADPPTAQALELALGQTLTLWNQLVAELKQELSLDGEDWHSSGPKYGWALRLQRRKRNILYLGPRSGSFLAALVLGDKAVAAVRTSDLPADLLQTIARTKRYGEGTPVRIEVKRPQDLKAVKALAKIKVDN